MPIDYEKICLKAGLEIHQQLNTDKLFCSCPSILRNDNPSHSVERKLNPVEGETGEIDESAKYEKIKNKTFIYQVFDTNCLVELDEEPPHEINKKALEIALQISTLLNCEIFPVTQIMRKTVIDGSSPSGFQRTALIAHDGYIDTSQGKVRIDTIGIEEDSARPVSEDEHERIFKLDRLGIPLVEIATAPDLKTPEQIKEAALKIGEILRACDVKRGIGTIRQDVNISIKNGNRIEIKGFQDPQIMIKTIDFEIERQENILKLKSKFSKSKLKEIKNLSHILSNTKCKIITNGFEQKKQVFGFKATNLNKILGIELQQGKRVGTDFSEYAKPFSKINGIIHSDENLSKYEFSEAEIHQIKKELDTKENDAFIIIVGTEHQAISAQKSMQQRTELFSKGVPKEVRKANPDATTSFLRPMPGQARMYPETDCQLLKIKKQEIDKAKANLPKLASENKKYLQEFGLNNELIKLILQEKKIEQFKELISASNYYDLAAKMLTIFQSELAAKENKSQEQISEILNTDILIQILEKIPDTISPNNVKSILAKIVQGKTLNQAITKSEINIKEEVKKLIAEKPGLSHNAYMGLIMKKFPGQISGKEISEILNHFLK